MKKAILIPIFTILFFPAWGQQKALSLDDCRTMALENNVRMKNARIGIEQARQVRREALTKYFPTVKAQGVWMTNDHGLIELDILPSILPPMYFIDNGVMGAVTATQPVLAGGQIVNSNKLAKVGYEVSGYQAELTRDEVVLTTEEYYWQYIGLQEKLRTVNMVEQLLASTYKDVDLYVKAGVTNRSDLMKVQLKVNSVKSTRLEIENGLSIIKMLLGQYIGMGIDDFAIAPDSLSKLLAPQNYKVDHQQVLPNTSSYRLLTSNVEAAKLQKRLAVGKNLPAIGVGASYSYDNWLDNDHRLGMVFASVSVPISDWWGGSHAIKKQKFALRIAELEKEDSSQLLLIRMQKCWNDLTEAYSQVALAKESIATAEENLRLNNDYYKAGTTTLTDLLDAQTSLQEARDRYTDSYTDYMVKLTLYLQATGR